MKTPSLLCAILIAGSSLTAFAADPAAIKPLGADGQPLNLDFETGTLKDWTATGDAFNGQPVKCDVVAKRRPDMKSEHQGGYWIGTFEKAGADKPQGTLTSVPFKITHPFASFLVGGGSSDATTVSLIVKIDGSERTVFRFSGTDTENLRRASANLTPFVGQEMFIRLTDKSGNGWGHLNFDDFVFHAADPKFANPILPRKNDDAPPTPTDDVKFAGLSPEAAADRKSTRLNSSHSRRSRMPSSA